MVMLIDGEWVDDDAKFRNTEGGAFVRPESNFRSAVSGDDSSEFSAEAGRYHLFLAPNCPWAHRTQLVRRIKGLEAIITISLSDIPRTRSWPIAKVLEMVLIQLMEFLSCIRLTRLLIPTIPAG